MQLQMNLKDNVKALFPTPLARFILPNSSKINPGLSRLLLDLEIQAGADRNPPLTGLNPGLDLLESNHPDICELMDSVRNGVLSMVGILARQKQFTARQKVEAHAEIYRPRSHCPAQADSESTWSGMYFIQAARLGNHEPEAAGQVSFNDPRSRVGLVKQPGTNYQQVFGVQPRDGMMLIYPSWLECSINGFVGNTAILLIRFKSRIAHFQARG